MTGSEFHGILCHWELNNILQIYLKFGALQLHKIYQREALTTTAEQAMFGGIVLDPTQLGARSFGINPE